MNNHTLSAPCPACSGTGRQPINLHSPQGMSAKRYDRSFSEEDRSVNCRNCGGQTMLGEATGQTSLRPDGSPCLHEYTYAHLSRCYGRYTCIHCGWSYDIDTGD